MFRTHSHKSHYNDIHEDTSCHFPTNPPVFQGATFHIPGAEVQTPGNQASYPADWVEALEIPQPHTHEGNCKHVDNPIDNPTRLVAASTFKRHYDELAARFPGIAKSNPRAIFQMARYDAQVETYGPDSVLGAPLVPDRIKACHPFAN